MKINLYLSILLFLTFFSKDAQSMNINIDRLYNSDSFVLIYKKDNKSEFIKKNHNSYKNLMLSERERIFNRRVEDICEDIYYGRNNYMYNPIEAKNCFMLHILQMSPRSAVKLINIKINEENYKKASFYYGILKSISERDNYGAKNFILNNINREEFDYYYLKGLNFIFNNDLLNNNNTFNKKELISFNYLETDKNNDYFKTLNTLKENNFNKFSKLMRKKISNGNQLLLLSQSTDLNTMAEFCFQYRDFLISFNCISSIIQNNINQENAINRMSYLLINQISSNKFSEKEIITALGFSGDDLLTRRLFLNFLNNDKEKIKNLMYFFNKGRMLRLNYNKIGENNE